MQQPESSLGPVSKLMISTLIFVLLFTSSLEAQQSELPPGVEMISDVVYAHPGGRDLKLDLFVPQSGAGPFAAVVYLHGGGWRSGSRRQFHGYAAQMATSGFVGVTIDYRLSQEAQYPAAVEDCRAAIHWIRANSAKYNVDPERIGVAGQSAGGHLAALLGVTADTALQVRAVAAFNPVLDLAAAAQSNPGEAVSAITSFLGVSYADNPDLWNEASPLAHVSENSAPMLLLHGTADAVVPYAQSVAMFDALKKAGVAAELYSVEGKGHLWFFNSRVDFQASLRRIEAFFQEYLWPKNEDEKPNQRHVEECCLTCA
jgi:acetyl esterase/lipase